MSETLKLLKEIEELEDRLEKVIKKEEIDNIRMDCYYFPRTDNTHLIFYKGCLIVALQLYEVKNKNGN